MNWLKKNKDAIVLGFVFLILAQISPAIINFFTNGNFAIKDIFFANIYKNAARFSDNTIITYIIISFIGVLLGFLIMYVIKIIFFRSSVKKSTKQIEDSVNVLDSVDEDFYNRVLSKKEDSNSQSYVDYKADLADVKKQIKDTRELTKTWKFVILIVFLTASILFECWLLVNVMILPSRINDSFNQSIEIIAPYTDNNTISTLKSKWRLMSSEDDYNEIDMIITDIRNKNDLW